MRASQRIAVRCTERGKQCETKKSNRKLGNGRDAAVRISRDDDVAGEAYAPEARRRYVVVDVVCGDHDAGLARGSERL